MAAFAYLFLPISEISLFTAFLGLFMIFIFFEFSYVSFLSLCTELIPDSRATMMALYFVAAGLGRVSGAFAGGFIWKSAGMGYVCTVSSIFTIIAVLFLIQGITPQKK